MNSQLQSGPPQFTFPTFSKEPHTVAAPSELRASSTRFSESARDAEKRFGITAKRKGKALHGSPVSLSAGPPDRRTLSEIDGEMRTQFDSTAWLAWFF